MYLCIAAIVLTLLLLFIDPKLAVAVGIVAPLLCLTYSRIYDGGDASKWERETIALFNDLCDGGRFIEISETNNYGDYRLPWLRSKHDGQWLDFDGYNSKLNIAVEVQGPHHYRASQSRKAAWMIGRINDREKAELAAKNNVRLIYVHSNVKREQLRDYVASRLQDAKALRPGITFAYIPVIPEPKGDCTEFIRNAKIVDRRAASIAFPNTTPPNTILHCSGYASAPAWVTYSKENVALVPSKPYQLGTVNNTSNIASNIASNITSNNTSNTVFNSTPNSAPNSTPNSTPISTPNPTANAFNTALTPIDNTRV